jgi:hypothetical protein
MSGTRVGPQEQVFETPLTRGASFHMISLPVDRFGKTATNTSGGWRHVIAL